MNGAARSCDDNWELVWACLVRVEISGWQMDTGVCSSRKSGLELKLLKFSAGGRA